MLAWIEAEVSDSRILKRLELTQELRDLSAELERMKSDSGPDLEALEEDFVQHPKVHTEAKESSMRPGGSLEWKRPS